MINKLYKISIFLLISLISFIINYNLVSAETISKPEYCTNPSNEGDIVNGHLCADSNLVMQCNASIVSVEEEGLPSKCESECDGYYYSFSEPGDGLFVADESSAIYRQMICNGLTYNGKKLNYLYTRNDKIKSVEKDSPTFYEKVKSDIENDVADSEMGNEEAETDKENAQKSTLKRNADVDGLDSNSESITINCSDFSAFHTIYVIILIIAPIIVIVLGSIDYAKAVMASDIEKMAKFKKKFPTRLILLVVLFLVPALIRLIIGLSSNLNNTVMNCIITGNDQEIKLNASKSGDSSGVKKGNVKQDSNPDLTTACSNACGSNSTCKAACKNNYNKSCNSIGDENGRATCYKNYAEGVADSYKNDTTSSDAQTNTNSDNSNGTTNNSNSYSGVSCNSCKYIQSSTDKANCEKNCKN